MMSDSVWIALIVCIVIVRIAHHICCGHEFSEDEA